MARDQAGGHALRKNVLEQVLEDGGRKELAGAADGGVLGQVLVHLVTQEVKNVQPQATVLDESTVADQIF